MKRSSCISAAAILLLSAISAAAQEAPEAIGASQAGALERAKTLIAGRRFDEAIATVSDALKLHSDRAELHLQLGRAYANKYFASRDVTFKEKALAALRKSLDIIPSLAYSHFMIGQIAYADRRH